MSLKLLSNKRMLNLSSNFYFISDESVAKKHPNFFEYFKDQKNFLSVKYKNLFAFTEELIYLIRLSNFLKMSLKIVCEKSVTRQKSGEQDSRLLSYASKNRVKGFFNDVELLADDECISANQMVLSCYSKYFENIFKTNLYNQQRCIIENVDGKSLKIFINYIYTGNIERSTTEMH